MNLFIKCILHEKDYAYKGIKRMILFKCVTLKHQRTQQRQGTSVSTLATSELATCRLMRAGSSYPELMPGLGYTDVLEREQLRAVYRRLYRLVEDL